MDDTIDLPDRVMSYTCGVLDLLQQHCLVRSRRLYTEFYLLSEKIDQMR